MPPTLDPALVAAIERAQLLSQGGDVVAARALLGPLWAAAARHAEHVAACALAHFLAGAYPDAADALRWHRRALAAALAAPADLRPWLPSLHGNIAEAALRLGDGDTAARHLAAARAASAHLPADGYGRMIRAFIDRLAATLAPSDDPAEPDRDPASAPRPPAH